MPRGGAAPGDRVGSRVGRAGTRRLSADNLRAISRPRGHGAGAGGRQVVGCAILTVSDTRRGAADRSGDAIGRLVERAGHRVVARAWVTDDVAPIRRGARALLARRDTDALIVTGGTGIAPRDRTIEALMPLMQIPIPGFGEVFRALSLRQVGTAAWLSRAIAGVAQGRLLVLLPGSTRAVELALQSVLLPELTHALRMLGRLQPEE